MPNIFIETLPKSRGVYELYRTLCIGYWNKEEVIEDYRADERMVAAIVNVGKACRWLVDTGGIRGIITLSDDRDGKDMRFNGEHNEIYQVLCSRSDYREYHKKYESFYGDYIRYLDKIRRIIDGYELTLGIGNKIDYDIR